MISVGKSQQEINEQKISYSTASAIYIHINCDAC